MSSRGFRFLLFIALLAAPCARGHHRWHPACPSTSRLRIGITDGNTPELSNRSRPLSISKLALVADRLKTEREETEFLGVRQSPARHLPPPRRSASPDVERPRSYPASFAAPLRC